MHAGGTFLCQTLEGWIGTCWYQDVNTEEDGLRFADSTRVREVYGHGVRTFSQFNLITDLPVTFNANCDILIIDLGSNDIAGVKSARPKAIKLLAEYLYAWVLRSRSKHVVFLSVLPRCGGLQGSVDTFHQHRVFYNKTLKKLCSRSSKTSFQKLRGFECDSQVVPMPVSQRSDDGIHPTNINKYAQRLRMIAM